jgi:hypothetical protein
VCTSYIYIKIKTDATAVMLGTATPVPADVGLNSHNKGHSELLASLTIRLKQLKEKKPS